MACDRQAETYKKQPDTTDPSVKYILCVKAGDAVPYETASPAFTSRKLLDEKFARKNRSTKLETARISYRMIIVQAPRRGTRILYV